MSYLTRIQSIFPSGDIVNVPFDDADGQSVYSLNLYQSSNFDSVFAQSRDPLNQNNAITTLRRNNFGPLADSVRIGRDIPGNGTNSYEFEIGLRLFSPPKDPADDFLVSFLFTIETLPSQEYTLFSTGGDDVLFRTASIHLKPDGTLRFADENNQVTDLPSFNSPVPSGNLLFLAIRRVTETGVWTIQVDSNRVNVNGNAGTPLNWNLNAVQRFYITFEKNVKAGLANVTFAREPTITDQMMSDVYAATADLRQKLGSSLFLNAATIGHVNFSGMPLDSTEQSFNFSVGKPLQDSLHFNSSLSVSGTFNLSPFNISLDLQSLLESAKRKIMLAETMSMSTGNISGINRRLSEQMALSSSIIGTATFGPTISNPNVSSSSLGNMEIIGITGVVNNVLLDGNSVVFTQNGSVITIDLLALIPSEGIHEVKLVYADSSVDYVTFLIFNDFYFTPGSIIKTDVPAGSGVVTIDLGDVRIDLPKTANDYRFYHSIFTLNNDVFFPYLNLSRIIEMGPANLNLPIPANVYFILNAEPPKFGDLVVVKREGFSWKDDIEFTKINDRTYFFSTTNFSPFFFGVLPPEGAPTKEMLKNFDIASANPFLPTTSYWWRWALWDQ